MSRKRIHVQKRKQKKPRSPVPPPGGPMKDRRIKRTANQLRRDIEELQDEIDEVIRETEQ